MIEPNGAVPPARFGHWAVVLDKKIYIFGGKTIDHKAMNDMFVFDTETNTWTQQITAVGFVPIGKPLQIYFLSTLLTRIVARSEASAALLPGTKTIVMSGGISINTLAFQDVFYFNTETCEWQVAWFDVPLDPVHAHTLSIIVSRWYLASCHARTDTLTGRHNVHIWRSIDSSRRLWATSTQRLDPCIWHL